MTSSPPTPEIGATLARVQKWGITWLAVLAPVTLLYLLAAFYVARETQGASKLLGLTPASAEAVLVDLLVAVVPMAIAIALYLRVLSNRRKMQRSAFAAAYDPHNLVSLPYYPALIYLREGAQLRLVWNADGQVEDGALYPVPEGGTLSPFDAAHFIAHGTP